MVNKISQHSIATLSILLVSIAILITTALLHFHNALLYEPGQRNKY